MYGTYPKTKLLRDGREAIIRLLTKRDANGLFEMFSSLSEGARKYLHDDVTNPDIVKNWAENANYKTVIPLILVLDEMIVADGILNLTAKGPMKHIGRIRIVVREDLKGLGIGTILMDELLEISRVKGLKLISVMLAEDEEADAIEAMTALGFNKEAAIRDYFSGPLGDLHNAVLMIKRL